MEWDFDNVPDTELVACGWWEYARESEFIRQTLARWTEDTEAPREDLEKLQAIGSPWELFVEGDVRRPEFPKPWQSLGDDTRAELVESMQYRPKPIEARADESVAKLIL